VGGNPELVEDGVTGRLIEAGDADGFASAFGAYAADRSLAVRHGAAGRAAAISKYSVAAMVAGYESVWARVAS